MVPSDSETTAGYGKNQARFIFTCFWSFATMFTDINY